MLSALGTGGRVKATGSKYEARQGGGDGHEFTSAEFTNMCLGRAVARVEVLDRPALERVMALAASSSNAGAVQ